MDKVRSEFWIPFPNKARLHWWNALFVYLRRNHFSAWSNGRQYGKLNLADTYYFKYERPLYSEFSYLPLPAYFGGAYREFHILPDADNVFHFESSQYKSGLTHGYVLLIAMEEFDYLKQLHSVLPVGRDADDVENLIRHTESFYLRKARSIEWLAGLCEYHYHRSADHQLSKLNIPLTVILGGADSGSAADQLVRRKYLELLKRFKDSFYPKLDVLSVSSLLKENPTRVEIEGLAREMGNILQKLI